MGDGRERGPVERSEVWLRVMVGGASYATFEDGLDAVVDAVDRLWLTGGPG